MKERKALLMKKCIAVFITLAAAIYCHAQYYNEWIDYSKTYYKCKVGKDGLYRIIKSDLPAAIQNTPAEQFQLWRNGQQVTIYTSVASGPLPSNGYIEFWGLQNDGKPDKNLYKNPANQFSESLSLETDSSTYFLTVNAGNSLRFADAVNDVAGNTLPADKYFTYHWRYNFQKQINRGKAVYFGTNVYSSTYDVGEWWASNDIQPASPLQQGTGELYTYTTGPNAVLNVSIAGASVANGRDRKVDISVNGSSVINQLLEYMNAAVLSNNAIVPSTINLSNNIIKITNINTKADDRIVTGFIDLAYPRQFNFGGNKSFAFSLAATTQGNYLEINNFNRGSATPILYDLTNNKRYTAVINGAILQFALPAGGDRNFVLVSEDASNINSVSLFSQRNFVDYTSTANQANYIIISNKILYTGTSGNPVDNYRQYRSSAAGGGYNAKVYDMDLLVDEFAYGIKNHPLSVKNFLRYARNNFAEKPAFCFLIGKAVSYDEARLNDTSRFYERLCLTPTFGWPASDNLLASDDLEPLPATPIGRLAAVSADEVQLYLDKVKEYEQQQVDPLQTIEEKAWQKTVVHVTGAEDAGLDAALTSHLNKYAATLSDTLFGANVSSFNRTSTGPPTTITDAAMTSLFNNGISLLDYFGHSSATVLAYNLNSPYNYSNQGKYPVFLVNGCNAGNIFDFDSARLSLISSLSENFVLAKERGSIAYVASSHFGVEGYLDKYLTGFYNSLANPGYGDALSKNVTDGLGYLLSESLSDTTTAILHAEENIIHGDPSIKINWHTKPDFVIEDPQVVINPSFISVADNSFKVKCYFYNIGKATGDSVSVIITQQYPDGTKADLFHQRIKSVRYIDSVLLTVPIVASRDKGENKLTVTIDDNFKYDELSESNNTVTKSFFIYEDELRPVYPYNFAIVNKSGVKLYASTADPLSASRPYVMEMDTTELFNSSLKTTQNITSTGGVLEFTPSIALTDSTVYYWRVAPVPADGLYRWNTSSFVYLPGSSFGFNQSHLYQHLKSAGERIYIDSNSRKWNYNDILTTLNINNAIYGFSGTEDFDFSIQLRGYTVTASACLGHSVIFNLFDPVTLKPYYNQAVPSVNGSGTYGGFMGSHNIACAKQGSEYNFEFSYLDTVGRRKMRDFMDWIPDGLLVTMRLIYDAPYDQTAEKWKADQLVYGVGNTFYDRLIQNGFTEIDSFSYPRTWIFNYKRNNSSYMPEWKFSAGLNDIISYQRYISSADTLGYITSPVFGPAKSWKEVKWRGASSEARAGDVPAVDVVGVNATGTETVLYTLKISQQDFDISSVSATSYPYIKLRMRNADSINLTPYQLRWWRILYDPVPEGALAGNIYYKFKDTVALGQPQDFAIAFKNISETSFTDSIPVSMIVYDASNVATTMPAAKLKKPLQPGDTATVAYSIPTAALSGMNNLYVDVNPNSMLPEQYHFNNFLYKKFLVDIDNRRPVMDVTFDGVHILNNDIVSGQPMIEIKLKDESNYLLLNDTTDITVKLIYPDGSERQFYYNTDTLKFTPATDGLDNTASVDFTPFLTTDGQYQLIVTGKDESGNPAGSTSYTVSFQVYNKPMISNLFNYPNPFTTSTAFVFTVTGSQVPQNIRIQILTITGKIVREITKDELGPLHIGRNITEYKWDGTDQYGQKLANGVYLYRVITNLNGKSLDKFPTMSNDGFETNTDQYFNKGYGKMYLMR